jgi:hypothetical protein
MSTIVYHQFTVESLSPAGIDREQFQDWCEANAPYVVNGRESFNDFLERLDGEAWGERVVDLGNSFVSPVFLLMRRIVRSVLREIQQ